MIFSEETLRPELLMASNSPFLSNFVSATELVMEVTHITSDGGKHKLIKHFREFSSKYFLCSPILSHFWRIFMTWFDEAAHLRVKKNFPFCYFFLSAVLKINIFTWRKLIFVEYLFIIRVWWCLWWQCWDLLETSSQSLFFAHLG